MVTLCLDFGNTRLKYAVFEGDEMKGVAVLENDSEQLVTELLDKYHPGKSILSSVIDHSPAIETILAATPFISSPSNTAYFRQPKKRPLPYFFVILNLNKD